MSSMRNSLYDKQIFPLDGVTVTTSSATTTSFISALKSLTAIKKFERSNEDLRPVYT